MPISIGKLRRIQQCSTPDNVFVVLALDHRDELRQALKPIEPDSLSYGEMAAFKSEVMRVLAPICSAILLDPEYGAAQAIAGGTLSGTTGLLVTVEAAGYVGQATDRRNELLPGWDVAKVARMGASAVKMRLYYHPEARHASKQEALVDEVAAACREREIPFFLEPVPYSLDRKSAELPAGDKRAVVIESARRLSGRGIDVLKSDFPLDTEAEPRRGEWEAACRELSEASAVPWVLRSGGASYREFRIQTEIACRCGAGGVVAGRAVWQEATDRRDGSLAEFLENTAVDRMVELSDIIAEHAMPWTRYFPSPVEDISESWYEQY